MKLKIKELREHRGYSQLKIAQYLYCDQSLYSRYESGSRSIPLGTAVRLADLYGVTLDYLVGRELRKKP